MYRRRGLDSIDLRWYEMLAILALIAGDIVGTVSLFAGGHGGVALFLLVLGLGVLFFLSGVWSLILMGFELFLMTGYMQDSWPDLQQPYGWIMAVSYILAWVAYLRNRY